MEGRVGQRRRDEAKCAGLQAERLRDLQAAQSRQAEARAEAEKRADAARAARERSAEAARSERERSAAEAQKRAAEDAARRAEDARSAEQARRAEEQKREAEARSKGPEVFISIYFTTDFPDVYYDKGTAERMAIDRRIVASGRQCNAEKGNFYPQEFHDPGLLNCQEKEDRFAKKTVFRCRHVQVIAKCRRSR